MLIAQHLAQQLAGHLTASALCHAELVSASLANFLKTHIATLSKAHMIIIFSFFS
jgi:hypothetical protein